MITLCSLYYTFSLPPSLPGSHLLDIDSLFTIQSRSYWQECHISHLSSRKAECIVGANLVEKVHFITQLRKQSCVHLPVVNIVSSL